MIWMEILFLKVTATRSGRNENGLSLRALLVPLFESVIEKVKESGERGYSGKADSGAVDVVHGFRGRKSKREEPK